MWLPSPPLTEPMAGTGHVRRLLYLVADRQVPGAVQARCAAKLPISPVLDRLTAQAALRANSFCSRSLSCRSVVLPRWSSQTISFRCFPLRAWYSTM